MKILIRKPKIESFVLMFFLLLPVLRDFVFLHIPLGYFLMDVMLIAMIGLCAISSRQKGSEYIDIIVLYSVIICLFLFKFFSDPSMTVWLTREFGVRHMLIMCGIFGYGVVRVQKDTQRMLSTMKIAGVILYLYYAYKSLEVLRNGVWTYYQFGQYWHTPNNMSWSYGVLLSICLLSIFVIIDKKIAVLVPIGLGLFGILVYGSRGTVVAFALGFLLVVLLVHEGKLRTRNYVIIGLLILITLVLFSDIGLSFISSWFQSHGLNSRFIDMLTSKKSLEVKSSGRFTIWTEVIQLIEKAPFFGYGVFGERNDVYNLGFQWGYSHNIFLELLVSFGCIIGGIIIIACIFGTIRFFRSSHDITERCIFVIFLTVSFELLVSNTIWLHYGPWCLLGLYVNHFKKKGMA